MTVDRCIGIDDPASIFLTQEIMATSSSLITSFLSLPLLILFLGLLLLQFSSGQEQLTSCVLATGTNTSTIGGTNTTNANVSSNLSRPQLFQCELPLVIVCCNASTNASTPGFATNTSSSSSTSTTTSTTTTTTLQLDGNAVTNVTFQLCCPEPMCCKANQTCRAGQCTDPEPQEEDLNAVEKFVKWFKEGSNTQKAWVLAAVAAAFIFYQFHDLRSKEKKRGKPYEHTLYI